MCIRDRNGGADDAQQEIEGNVHGRGVAFTEKDINPAHDQQRVCQAAQYTACLLYTSGFLFCLYNLGRHTFRGDFFSMLKHVEP